MELNEIKSYKKKYIEPNSIKLDKFELLEMLIFIINYLEIKAEINEYYLVLGRHDIIIGHEFSNKNYLLQNARILLKTLNQKKVYIDALNNYEKSDDNNEKLYLRKDDQFIINESIPKRVKKKEELFLKLLSLDIKYKLPKINYAFQNNEKTYVVIINDKPIEVELKDIIQPIELPKFTKKIRKEINVDINELIKASSEEDNFLNKANPYREKILKNSVIKELQNGTYKKIERIVIKNITNIIGQVAAGKSTFSDALLKVLSDQNRKIVIIMPTVMKVLEKCKELEKLKIKSASVIGVSSWKEHIEKSNNGVDFLDEYDSKVLTAGCVLGGFIKDYDVAIEYGKEPCKNIYSFYERGLEKGKLNKKIKYKCPFYYQCPKTIREMDIVNSNVIVTTTAALINTQMGISGMTLFQYVLENIDLVIVDEAESELKKADNIFAPTVSYDNYIVNNRGVIGDYYKNSLSDRTGNSEMDKQKFISLYTDSNNAFTKIYTMLRDNKQGIALSYLKRPFSGKRLINICNEKQLLPIEIIKELDNMVGFEVKEIYKGIIRSSIKCNDKETLYEIFEGYDKPINIKLTEQQSNIMLFIISVLYFESLYREISALVEGNEVLPMSTKEVLSQRFEFQQRYIPTSPIGNIFALQYKEGKEIGNPDLYIVKQFAHGRAMYLRFPWLKLDIEGKPMGPKVLLLSGSSFAPLSYANHINEQVNYIIEAEEYKREFISKSKFEYMDLGIRVSGSGNKRNENLRKLIEECKQLILDKLEEKDNNLLLIVNSYEEAKIVSEQLKDMLKDTEYKDDILYLVSDSEYEDYEKINQSKVSSFSSRKARMLIAPAILIERGHNIVDKKGNAAFDILVFLTRPMGNPSDYSSHVQKVNGKIASQYSNLDYDMDISMLKEIRKKSNIMYNRLDSDVYSLSQLREDLQDDIVVSLFVMILQIFGRLCRIGNEENLKENPPEVYFVDAAFKSKNKNGFDFLNRLVDYLEELMKSEDVNGEVARTLYEPFYKALKNGRGIYDEK